MKTQMRSRWEIFEDPRRRGDERERRFRDGGTGEGQAKGSSDEEERGGGGGGGEDGRDGIRARRSHSWHAECNEALPLSLCYYLRSFSSLRLRSAASRAVHTKVLCRHLRYRTAGRVHNNTGWNTSRHPRRRCENRSCVTTSIGYLRWDRVVARLSVSPLFSVSPARFVTSLRRGERWRVEQRERERRQARSRRHRDV